MHSCVCNAVSVVSMVATASILGQFAHLRWLTNAKPGKALQDGFAVISSPLGPVYMGWDLGSEKKGHPEQCEHSHARVVR